jgi:hypothetical protein
MKQPSFMSKLVNKSNPADVKKTGRKTKTKGLSLLQSDLDMFEPIRRKYLGKALFIEGANTKIGDNEIVRAGLIALLEQIPDAQLVEIVMSMQRSKRGRESKGS